MRGLRELQQDFAAYLTGGDPASLNDVVADTKISAAQCLNIHRNNVTISLRASLAAVYPVVQQLVGEAFFNDVANNYLRVHPCRSGNLHDFGQAFSAVLRDDPRLVQLGYLPDVAALEWAFHVTYHGPHASAFDLAKLQQWSPAQFSALRFSLHPGMQLLRSPHPVLTIWEAHQGGDVPEGLDLGIGAEYVLVIRPELHVELHRLSAADFDFLHTLDGGATLEQATEAAIASDDQFDLETRLAALVSGGVIVDVCE